MRLSYHSAFVGIYYLVVFVDKKKNGVLNIEKLFF